MALNAILRFARYGRNPRSVFSVLSVARVVRGLLLGLFGGGRGWWRRASAPDPGDLALPEQAIDQPRRARLGVPAKAQNCNLHAPAPKSSASLQLHM